MHLTIYTRKSTTPFAVSEEIFAGNLHNVDCGSPVPVEIRRRSAEFVRRAGVRFALRADLDAAFADRQIAFGAFR